MVEERSEKVISPEQQIQNVLAALRHQVKRGGSLSRSNRRRRGQAYEYPNLHVDAVHDGIEQLGEMIGKYLAGELEAIVDDGNDF